MVNQTKIAIGYFLAFIAVYFCNIAYGIIPVISEIDILPQSAMTQNVGNVTMGLGMTQTTVSAGFGLIAVGIIVLAAFGMINIFGGYE